MKAAHFACLLLLPLLLNSCQNGPQVSVIINELRPGMLKGKTVGMEGMVITSANWPGKGIEAPVLCAAEKALRGGLKGAHVYIMDEEGMVIESAEMQPCKGTSLGKVRAADATKGAETRPGQPDYIFRIMLRSDSNTQTNRLGRDLDYTRFRNVNVVGGGGISLFGWGNFNSARRWYPPDSASSFYNGGYVWSRVATRTLKADYILSDSKTCKVIWRAEAVASNVHVNINNSVAGYQSPADLVSEIPLRPLWITMNKAAERTIKKSGTSSYQTVVFAGNHVIYP